MTIPEYLKAYQNYKNEKHNMDYKVALLSSFTIKGLKEIMTVDAYQQGISLDIYEGGYQQIMQEILDPQSTLYDFKPNIVYILWDVQTLLGDYFFRAYERNEDERRNFIQLKLEEVQKCLDFFSKHINGQIVINNFQIPDYSPLGVIETRQKFGLFESVEYINRSLADIYREHSSIFIYDYNHFASCHGYRNIKDNKMYYLGDMKIELQLISKLSKDYLSYISALVGKNRKCLVLDLDNTLWGGIIGEDGINGIKLGLDYEGKAYYEFQKYIHSLYLRGVILAVNSRNNYEDVREVLQNHNYMILREDCFAAVKANWNNKVENIREIAQELNIGLDSMIFMDDDKFNCEMMRTELPEVKTIELSGNAVNYPDVIKELTELNIVVFTKEDFVRNRMYSEDRKRELLKTESNSLEEYLNSLNIKVTFFEMEKGNVERIAQLTQKTNQFNLTTKRYTGENLWEMSEKGYHIYGIEVVDNYGDNGICGVIIYQLEERKRLVIDTMLLSCRVMGRKIEDHYFEFLRKEAKKHQMQSIAGYYLPTPKNKPVKDLFQKYDFIKVNSVKIKNSYEAFKHEAEEWVLDIESGRQEG